MTIIVMENVPPSLRGECTRYLLEIKSGVFIGTLNSMVREKFWENVKEKCENGNCLLTYAVNNEQGFVMEAHGDPKRSIIDFDGLQLVKIQ